MPKRSNDLTGRQYGELKVVKQSPTPGYWITQCSCGLTKTVRGASLVSGNTKSCGHLRTANPGRPKISKEYQAVHYRDLLTGEMMEHLKAVKRLFKAHGIDIKGDHITFTNRMQQKVIIRDNLPSPISAIGYALQHLVIEPKVK